MTRVAVNKLRVTRDEKDDQISIKSLDNWIFRIMLIGMTLIPLIIGAKDILFISPLVSGTGITETAYQLDTFTYFKFVFLLFITILTISLFLYKILFLNYKIKINIITISLFLFVISLTLSVVFADYKTIALWGLYNRHDGAITFICYALLMFIALNIKYPTRALNYLIYTLYPFVWINVVLALLNLYGVNLLQYSTFQKFFTVFLMDEMSISEGSVLTGTLNQWNYMSGYSAVMAIIFLTLTIFYGSFKSRLINLLTAIAAFSTILASISTSGFISLLVLILIMIILIFMRKNIKLPVLWLSSFILLAAISIGILSKHNPQVWTESVGFLTNTNPFIQEEGAYKPSILDLNKVSAANSEFKLPELPGSALSGGSGRVYIWETMIPLIKEKLITGYGLDTLTFHFPQNDIDKRSGFMYENILVDKPHNLYLGILYGTGILGFLSFMSILIVITTKLSKYVIKGSTSPFVYAFLLGWGAFLIQALFNDSVIGATFVPLIATTIAYAISNNKVEEEII